MTIGAGNFRYRLVEGWGRGPQGHDPGGTTAGIAVDSHNRAYISRYNEGRREILVYEPDGRFLRRWGEELFAETHFIGIGPDDMLYCADPRNQTVLKLTPHGELLMTLGTPGQVGAPGLPFNWPTKAVVSPAGDIFVADGYMQNRVHRFSPAGALLYSWGEDGAAPGQLNEPHSIALDHQGRVLVADRKNNRIQVFDAGGAYLAEWKDPDMVMPHDISVGPDGRAYVPHDPIDKGCSRISVFSPEGELLARFGEKGVPSVFSQWLHGLCVDLRGDLYVTDKGGVNKLERV